MPKKCYYLPLDEDFLQDPDIQLFIEVKGKEAVFDYLMLLMRIRDYKCYHYMIPRFLLPIIAKRDLGVSTEKLQDTIDYCTKIGLLKEFESDEATYIYSARRKRDLEDWDIKSARRSEAGKKGNDKRWNKDQEEEAE